MRKFCTSGFFTGIAILVYASMAGVTGNKEALQIWTIGMAVGMLASKHDA